jgi:DnaJ-class molecular chaperone
VLTIADEGMPIHTFPSQHGSLHIRFIVDIPKRLTASDIELVEEIFS